MKENIFKIFTSTKSLFAYVKNANLFLINDQVNESYQFTQTLNEDRIIYGYKLNNKLRVFFNGGNNYGH